MSYLVVLLTFVISVHSYAADWSSEAVIPGDKVCETIKGHYICFKDGNRENIFELPEDEFKEAIKRGANHVMQYPVDITLLKIPEKSMDKFFNEDSSSLLRRFIFKIAKTFSRFKSFDDIYNWLGLHDFPKSLKELGPNFIPEPIEGVNKMGATRFDNHGHYTQSFSCAACHSSDLFGVKVVGLTNRFSRANEFFVSGQKGLQRLDPTTYSVLVGPIKEDYQTYVEARDAIEYVGVRKPLALGLDTSLAQVGLSLARRGLDEYATKNDRIRPRKNPLETEPADSKPAVWWNLKYKTKWLSDGSIDSGNPIHTNFLWNEIGRGIDLRKLESWLVDNHDKVKDLTAYVFATKAPRFNDFFPNHIDIERAKRGEKLYLKSCKGCHGIYEKGWSDPSILEYEQKLSTTKVWYHEKTPNIDVGTDEYRRKGMGYFAEDLNRLKISKTLGTVVTEKDGYTPPPLIGIWSRWPYLHNNSVPTLYHMLSSVKKRPKTYIAVPAKFKKRDFSIERNGYPPSYSVRMPYRKDKEYRFDTRKKGLSNKGHVKMMLNEDGSEKFSHEQKLDIISFLQSL